MPPARSSPRRTRSNGPWRPCEPCREAQMRRGAPYAPKPQEASPEAPVARLEAEAPRMGSLSRGSDHAQKASALARLCLASCARDPARRRQAILSGASASAWEAPAASAAAAGPARPGTLSRSNPAQACEPQPPPGSPAPAAAAAQAASARPRAAPAAPEAHQEAHGRDAAEPPHPNSPEANRPARSDEPDVQAGSGAHGPDAQGDRSAASPGPDSSAPRPRCQAADPQAQSDASATAEPHRPKCPGLRHQAM
jgi:hypothetical protein